MEIGKAYYIMTHAYHHIVGIVKDMPGPKTAVLSNPIRVQSCQRGWTDFFNDGFLKDTNYTHFPEDTEVCGWFLAAPFNHPIPENPHANSTKRR